ncbi:MAG: DUF4339 domain-containing protein [Nitrospira sp.]|nr:DUF4339 domain-containing protein [Nitrospira sp.]
MADWYWMKNGEKHGPVDTAHLKQLAQTGQLQPTDTIWREGLPNWVPASQADGLKFGAARGARSGTSVATAPARPSSQQPGPSRGIIKYRCVHCGGGLESEGRFAGKQDTCPMCGKATPVPLSSTMGAGAFFRKIPKAVYIGTAAVVLVAVISLTAWLALRDTWERDHGPELRQMSEQTISLIRAGKDEEGVAKYEAMLALVGDRQLEDPLLRQAVTDAHEKAEPARRKVNETKNLARLRSLEDRAKAFAASGEVKRAIDAYRQALDLIQETDIGNPQFAAAIQRISGQKRQLEDQLTAIEAEEARRAEEQRQREQQAAHEREMEAKQAAHEREMEAKGYVKHRGQWVTKEEYAKLTARGKLRLTATYFYNDFKGNVPGEAAVFAIPKDRGLQGKKIPGRSFWTKSYHDDGLRKFMEDIGGAFGWAGGDGRVELRLEPGSYEVLVLMEVLPYFSSDIHARILVTWFSEEFAKSHGVLGRYGTETVEVYPSDTTEASINLK